MLILSSHAYQAIQQHAQQCYPYECVGLLLGSTANQHTLIQQTYPIENRIRSPQARFLLQPQSYLQADIWARAHNMDIVAIYHSHPDQAARPSAYDLAGLQATGTGWLYFIQSVYAGNAGDLCAWQVQHEGSIMCCTYLITDNREPRADNR